MMTEIFDNIPHDDREIIEKRVKEILNESYGTDYSQDKFDKLVLLLLNMNNHLVNESNNGIDIEID